MYMGELPEIGQPDPKLVSIRRRVENSRHEYPEEQVALVGKYELDFLCYMAIRQFYKICTMVSKGFVRYVRVRITCSRPLFSMSCILFQPYPPNVPSLF